MHLKIALLATATAGAFLVVAACGGGGADSAFVGSSGTGTNPASTNCSASGSGTNGNGSGITAKYVTIDLNCSACYGAEGTGLGDGEQVGSGRIDGSGTNGPHALLWRGSASSVVDLGSAEVAVAAATSGGVQVGWFGNDKYDHAVKWAGSASSVVNLHPGGVFRESKAFGIAGDQVIGYGDAYTYAHALLWTSRGIVDLNPNGVRSSVGLATDGTQQVGYGSPTGATGIHALLWRGTAESVVDLHPASGYASSFATSVSSGYQVGWGGDFGSEHALLWAGSAQSLIDLHPGSGYCRSFANGVNGGQQVGWGTTADGSIHALAWNGTADSVVDLHVFLPAGFTRSIANGIDASGNIIGSADGHAILWVRQ